MFRPICSNCFVQRFPGQAPIRLRKKWPERRPCGWCGGPALEGIYTRSTLGLPAGPSDDAGAAQDGNGQA